MAVFLTRQRQLHVKGLTAASAARRLPTVPSGRRHLERLRDGGATAWGRTNAADGKGGMQSASMAERETR